MNDKVDKLAQLGTFQLVIGVAVLFAGFTIIKTETVLDEHVQARGAAVEKALEQQTALLRDIQNELRRLQDQRRTVDELKEALRAAPPVVYAAPQQAYGPPAPQQAQPQQAQPQQAQPPQPHTGPEAAAPRAGEGTQIAAASMGIDKNKVAGPDPNAVVGGHIVTAMSEPSTLNYYTTSEGATRQVMRYIIEPLFTVSEQDATKLSPRLATSWELAEDKLSATYRLRPGVKWSDGAPFSADDVLFTYQVIMDPKVKAEAHRGSYTDVEAVEKVDDLTVRVRFKRKYWPGIYVAGNSMFIIPKHWYADRIKKLAAEKGLQASTEPGQEGFGACFNQLREPCVGTGPYFMPAGGWVAAESLTLERNPTCWRLQAEPGTWNIQTQKVRFISDQLAIMNQVRQQKIDVQVVDTDQWLDGYSKEKVITDNYNYYNYDHVGLGFNYIAWNCRKFPFDDAKVRNAMTHLVDRAGMLRDMWRNNGVVATCPNKPIYPEYNKSLAAHAFDPAKAAALLKEAGFVDHDGDGVLDKKVGDEWKRFEFELKVPSGRTEYEAIGTKVKEAMEKVGVRCDIRPIEWSVFIEHLYDRKFDAVCLYSSFSNPWIDNFEEYHSSEDIPRGGNTSGWHTPEVDQLLTELRQEFDREKRIPQYHRLYQLIHEAQPLTLLIHGRVDVLAHKRFQNVVVRHAGMVQTYWWVDPNWKSPNN